MTELTKVQDLFNKETKKLFSKSDFQISDEQAAAGSGHWSRPSCSGRRFVKVERIFLVYKKALLLLHSKS